MVRFESYSEAGGHPINEDAFLVAPHPADPDCWLCCLADGQGGHAGGQRAAQLACRVVLDAALRLAPRRLTEPFAWMSSLKEADAKVAADPEAGFTTLIGLGIVGGALWGASSGDSKALATGSGGVRELTARTVDNGEGVGAGAAGRIATAPAIYLTGGTTGCGMVGVRERATPEAGVRRSRRWVIAELQTMRIAPFFCGTALLGGFAFWLPSILLHAVHGENFSSADVSVLTILLPVISVLAVVVAQRLQSSAKGAASAPLAIGLGIWVLGPLSMSVSSFGGVFAKPGAWIAVPALTAFFPLTTFMMATYDGSLGGLLLGSVALVGWYLRGLLRGAGGCARSVGNSADADSDRPRP